MTSRTIRIGTRDSELAMWQATTVQRELEAKGYKTELVAVKSKGDLVLDKPLYEFGITGVFTKVLDIAMLQGEIDIAVHSMKDVPTQLPKGIVQAAVLPRGPVNDIMVLKDDAEFLENLSGEATIATGSLRRKAFWNNRFPRHTVENLRGNVNTRLRKLDESNWNGAIFAHAGLKRINLLPAKVVDLSWMLPAPAQGIVMVVAMENDSFAQEACAHLNHEHTAWSAKIERDFLRKLEGGCTAPIGALAVVNDKGVQFQGALLNVAGDQKIEVHMEAGWNEMKELGNLAAEDILSRGGKAIIEELKRSEHFKKNS